MKTKHFFLILINIIFFLSPSYTQSPSLDWVKQAGGTSNDYGQSITTDANGNIYTTGYFKSTVDFDPGNATTFLTSSGIDDIFIQKMDANGIFLWAKQIGGSDNDEGKSITTDINGNVYITGIFGGSVDFDPGAGTTYLSSGDYEDIFILKLDSNGNFLWAKAMGGPEADEGRSIITDASGNVYTTGVFQESVDFDPSSGTAILTSPSEEDAFVQKLDANGNFVWVKQISGLDQVEAYSITTDSQGNLYTAGCFEYTTDFDPGPGTVNLTSLNKFDLFIQKMDSNGNFLWAKNTGGIFDARAYSTTTDANNNIYITGVFEDSIDFDPGIGTTTLTSLGYTDIFIQKLDANGNFIWAKSMGGIATDRGYSISIDANSNVYTTGHFSETADFDPSSNTKNLISAGGFDIFIQKLDSNGNFLWAESMGGTSFDRANSITTDANGSVYTTGEFAGTSDFEPGTASTNITSIGAYDIFILKLSTCSSTFATDVIVTCDSFTWIDGITYTVSNNTATDTLINAAACDSIITLNLTINSVSDNSTSLNGNTITANNAGAQYTWLDCDNNYTPIAGETNQSFTATSNGNYAVEIMENACLDTSECVNVATVGIDNEMLSANFIVYPNPTDTKFTIQFDDLQTSVTIRILSLLGEEIQNEKFQNTNSIQLELKQAKGIYLLEISDEQNNSAILKLIKE